MTEREAVEKSLELWEWLAETGANKMSWPKRNEFTPPGYDCFLCDYIASTPHVIGWIDCKKCPLVDTWGGVDTNCRGYYCEYNPLSPYKAWRESDTCEDRKKYATIVVEGLKNWLKKGATNDGKTQ